MDTGESALHFWDPEFCDFENRVPIGASAQAHMHSTFGEMLKKNARKSSKIDFFKKLNKCPRNSSNILNMFSTNL